MQKLANGRRVMAIIGIRSLRMFTDDAGDTLLRKVKGPRPVNTSSIVLGKDGTGGVDTQMT